VQQRWSALREAGDPAYPALQQAVEAVFDARIGDISGRGKLAADMREIWLMQPRFERRSGNTPRALVEQPRYRAGYDFLRLRADAGEVDAELAEWWEDFALGDEDERVALLQAARELQPPRRVVSATPRAADAPLTADAPARKRRRRRRKPAGSEGADTRAPDGPAPALPD
jgi:poly(A) polymerase